MLTSTFTSHNTMLKLEVYPKNQQQFLNLITFAKECVTICNTLQITPIIYGSVAYLFYTKDYEIDVNDVDFLIVEGAMDTLMKEFDKSGFRYEMTTYHSLKVFKDKLKISFDSSEHYLGNLSSHSFPVSIDNFNFYILNPESLMQCYTQGSETIPSKAGAYLRKAEKLKNIRT